MLLRRSYLSLSAGDSLRMGSKDAKWLTILSLSTKTSYNSVLCCSICSDVPASMERWTKIKQMHAYSTSADSGLVLITTLHTTCSGYLQITNEWAILHREYCPAM